MGAVNVVFEKQEGSDLLKFVAIENDSGTETHQEEWRDREDGKVSLRIVTLFYDESKTWDESATHLILRVWRNQLPSASLATKVKNVLQNLRERASNFQL